MLRNTKRSWGMACAFIILAACWLPAGAQAVGPVPVRVATLLDNEIEILTFLCGERPTPDELDRFVHSKSAKIRQNPAYWANFDATQTVPSLERLRGSSIAARGETWLKWRMYYAFENVDGTPIVAAHDPIVMADRNRQILITETTLKIMGTAAYWLARQTGQPLPDGQYIPNTRNKILQQRQTLPTATLVGLTQIVARFPSMVENLQSLPEGRRRQILANLARGSGGALNTAPAMSGFQYSQPRQQRQQQPQQSQQQQQQAQANLDQTQSWAFNQNMQRNFCSSMAFGQFTQGTGAFCRAVP